MRSVSEARAVRKMIGRLRQFGIVADPFADIEPVGIGQHDVQQDEVRTDAAAEVERAPARLGPGETESLLFRGCTSAARKIRVVFDQHNSFCHGTFSVTVGYVTEGLRGRKR